MKMHKPVILYTTPILQYPPVGGPTLRVENSIKALAQISDLHICSRVSLDQMGGVQGVSFYRRYSKEFHFVPFITPSVDKSTDFAKRLTNFCSRRLLRRNILRQNMRLPKEDYHNLLHVADSISADVIWLGYGNISYDLLKFIKRHSRYKVVLDSDSVWSRYILRGVPFAQSPEEKAKILKQGTEKEKEEIWGTQIADVTTAVSKVDAEYYLKLARIPEQVRLFANVIDLNNYCHVPDIPNDFKKPCIYLAGSFWKGSPMEDAARWLITRVIPRITKDLPNVHLYIVGSGSDTVLSDFADANVSVVGRLDSVLPYLCNVDVALVPLRYESGTRFKILEAGACDIPVVSTRLGAEGLNVVHGRDILIADAPEDFAQSTINLITNKDYAKTLGANLNRIVSEQYSISVLAEQGKTILDYLLARPIPNS